MTSARSKIQKHTRPKTTRMGSAMAWNETWGTKRRCEFEAEVANRTTAPVGEAAYATKVPCSAANPVDSRTHWYECHCNSVCPWARASCFAVRASSTSVGEESLLAHPYQLEWCSLHCAAPRANHAHAGKSWCVLQKYTGNVIKRSHE